MKKVIFFFASMILVGSINAQLTSKKGENYLPEAGEYAIGADASAMLSYFGNMLNGGSNSGFGMGFTNAGAAITGKKFMTNDMAYRGMVRLGFGSESTPGAIEGDVQKDSYSAIMIGAGMEKRRGSTRLQGYYGAMVGLGFGGSKTTYEYANNVEGDLLEEKDGSTFGIGARAFVGCEYFVLPKISIGGEFGWGLTLSSTGDASITNYSASGNTTTTTAGGSSFGIDTDNNAFGVAPAQVLVHFHF
jgi:hypothetical protein